VYAPWVVLHARRRSDDGRSESRLGVIASKRVGGAVARNRARRALREAARTLLREAGGPWDVLLVARPEALRVGFAERLRVLREMLTKAGVLEESRCPS